MTDSRRVASRVLTRVWEDEAYAAAALSSALDQHSLSSADRALATELVYGVLRTEGYLRRWVEQFGKLKKSDTLTASHLLLCAYQLAFCDRVPARAAVNEAVKLVGEARDRRVAGFVNAVCRKLAQSAEQSPPAMKEAVLASTPSWLRRRLVKAVGQDEMEALLVPVKSPRPTVRLRGEPGELQASLEPTPLAGVFRYVAGGDPRKLPEFSEGRLVVQELGAQWIAELLASERRGRVLDVCAGRGQKSLLLAEREGNQVLASDLHPHKLQALDEEAKRLGTAVETRAHDWTEPCPEDLRGSFDAVIVDAPCTGVGTLRRRPEILRRLGSDDPARMAQLQTQILTNASQALTPDGVLLFATCSVLPEEGEQVVAAVAELLTPHELGETLLPVPLVGEPSALRLLPGAHGTDGYFVACLRLPS